MDFALSALMGYLIGCLNPSYFISKAKGFDIRKKGTGNAGATNTMFVIGFKLGLVVMLFDVFKAFFAIQIAKSLFSGSQLCCIISGIFCSLGHIFPFYMHFTGGKGTACLAGIVLALTPKMIIPMLLGAFLLGLIFNRGSVLPIAAVVSYPFLYYFSTHFLKGTLLIITLVPLFFWSHRKNFLRLFEGRESSFRKVVFGRNLENCIERKNEKVD